MRCRNTVFGRRREVAAIALLLVLGLAASACFMRREPPALINVADICSGSNDQRSVMIEGYFLDFDEVECRSRKDGKKKCMLDFTSSSTRASDEKLFAAYLTHDEIGPNILKLPKDLDSDYTIVDFQSEVLPAGEKVRLTGVVTKGNDELKKLYKVSSSGCFLDAVRVEKAILSETETAERESGKKEAEGRLAAAAMFVKEHPELGIRKTEMHPLEQDTLRLYTSDEKMRDVSAALDPPKSKPLVDAGIKYLNIFGKTRARRTNRSLAN